MNKPLIKNSYIRTRRQIKEKKLLAISKFQTHPQKDLSYQKIDFCGNEI